MLQNPVKAGLEAACKFNPDEMRFAYHDLMYEKAARKLSFLAAHLPNHAHARRAAAHTMLYHLKAMYRLAGTHSAFRTAAAS